jgi:hypothetical protein
MDGGFEVNVFNEANGEPSAGRKLVPTPSAAAAQARIEATWLIRAPGWIGCTIDPRVDRQARIHHGNSGSPRKIRAT